MILLVGLVVFARRLRQQLLAMGADERSLTAALPDFAGTLYLTMAVLAGSQVAIPFAIVVPFIARGPELTRWPASEAIACLKRGAFYAVTLLAASVAYRLALAAVPAVATNLRANIIASVAASVAFLVSVILNRIWREWRLRVTFPLSASDGVVESEWRRALSEATRACFSGQALLFQTLLLCCVPLLPLTEALPPEEFGLAWTLLLAPMVAVYYLALTGVRLSEQTAQLRKTVAALNDARLRESQLKTYAALITQAQEDERRRLARELHDDTAQALVALARGLDALGRQHVNPFTSPEDVRFVDQLVDLTQRTLESVRRACQDLRPSVLDDLGLSAALDSLAGSMETRGLRCDYSTRGHERAYPSEVLVAVYRIAQEALSNALRHGEARRAQVELVYRPEGLLLAVTDDGRGFDANNVAAQRPVGASRRTSNGPTSERTSTGLGLVGMRERATLVGATLAISSAPGAGTRVTLMVPAEPALGALPSPEETSAGDPTMPSRPSTPMRAPLSGQRARPTSPPLPPGY